MSWGHAKLLWRWIAKEHGVHWRHLRELLHAESGAHWHLSHLLRSLELWHTHELWWHLHHLLLLLKSHHLLHLLLRHHLLLWSLHLLLLWWLLLHLLKFWRSLNLDCLLNWFLLLDFLFSFNLLWCLNSFFDLLNYLSLFLFLQLFVSLMNFNLLFSLNLISFRGLVNNLGLLLLLLLLSLEVLGLLLLHHLLLLKLLLLLLLLLLHHGLLLLLLEHLWVLLLEHHHLLLLHEFLLFLHQLVDFGVLCWSENVSILINSLNCGNNWRCGSNVFRWWLYQLVFSLSLELCESIFANYQWVMTEVADNLLTLLELIINFIATKCSNNFGFRRVEDCIRCFEDIWSLFLGCILKFIHLLYDFSFIFIIHFTDNFSTFLDHFVCNFGSLWSDLFLNILRNIIKTWEVFLLNLLLLLLLLIFYGGLSLGKNLLEGLVEEVLLLSLCFGGRLALSSRQGLGGGGGFRLELCLVFGGERVDLAHV